jgi:hypothetical protein
MVDIYGLLIPGANVSFVDTLEAKPQQNAETSPHPPAHQREMEVPPDLLGSQERGAAARLSLTRV